MTLFAIPKLDKFGMMAFIVMAVIVPIYAVASFEGTMETSVSRWLALHIVIAEAVVVVLAVFAGWRPINSWKELPAHVRIAIALWLTVATIATICSSDVPFSATFQSFWIIHGLFAWALWAMLSTKWRAMQLPLLVYFSLSLLLHSLAVYFVAWVLLGPNLADWEPYMVGATNPRLYIFYASTLLGIGLGFLIARQNRAFWFLAFLLIFASYHLFAWSGGRASFGVSLMLPLIVAILARKLGKRIILTSFGFAAVAFPLSLLTAPEHPWFGFKSIIGRISIDKGPNEYASGRLEIWIKLLEESLRKPVFGHGQVGGLSSILEGVQGFPVNPHNALVHIAHAWGGVGLLAFAIGLFPFIPTIRVRLCAQPSVAWPAFIALLGLAGTSLLDGTLFYNQPLFFTALSIAILASVPTTPKSEAKTF